MPQIFIRTIDQKTVSLDYEDTLSVGEIKKRTNVAARLFLSGRELLGDEARIGPEDHGATLRWVGRLRGGDFFSDIFDSIINIFRVVLKIFDGVIFLIQIVWCGIQKIGDLWWCSIYYLIFLFFYLYVMVFYTMAYIVDCIIDPFLGMTPCVDFLNFIKDSIVNMYESSSDSFPGLANGLGKIMVCFRC